MKYEKNIGLKNIWLTIIRRFKTILLIFVPIAVTTLIVTTFVLTKTYQSSATISKTTVFNAAQHQILQSYASNEETITKMVDKLKEKDIKHSNGKEISASDIVSGLSFSALNTSSIYVTIFYQTTDKSIAQPVLEELTAITVDTLKNDETTKKDFSSVAISSSAGAAVKNSKEKKYLLIGIAAGLVVACGLAFIDEVISDEVYDKSDVELLGCEAFELTTSD